MEAESRNLIHAEPSASKPGPTRVAPAPERRMAPASTNVGGAAPVVNAVTPDAGTADVDAASLDGTVSPAADVGEAPAELADQAVVGVASVDSRGPGAVDLDRIALDRFDDQQGASDDQQGSA